jgi:hypothetical protein
MGFKHYIVIIFYNMYFLFHVEHFVILVSRRFYIAVCLFNMEVFFRF